MIDLPWQLFKQYLLTLLYSFIERLNQESPAKLSISWPLLRHLVGSWSITAQLFPMLVPQSFKTRRDSSSGIFAKHNSTEVEGEFCFSFYHCQNLSPIGAGETTRWETHRVVVYNQATRKYSRWILIGPAYLNELQRGFPSGLRGSFERDSRYLNSSAFILIAYAAACSWQSMLNDIEDHMFLVRVPPGVEMAEEAYEDIGRCPS